MPLASVLIVSGPPCTGKTTLGRRLASDLALPFISKDRIKEALFDSLGWRDRARSRQLGRATYELLFLMMEIELEAGRSFVVESNFDPLIATPGFLDLRKKYPFHACQVLCRTDGEVLLERFKTRSESGERHPGHVDHTTYDELAPVLLEGHYEPLDIDGAVFEVDTTDFAQIDYASLLESVRAALPGQA